MTPRDFEEGGKYHVGRVVSAISASYEASRTEPPSRYTQSDLIDDMMAAHKFASNDRDRSLLKEIAGLGTSRTREPTISGLIEKGFITLDKSRRSKTRVDLKPTEAAMTTIANLPDILTNPATTAKWEMAFQLIEKNKANPDDVKKYFLTMLNEVVHDAKTGGPIKINTQKSTVNQFSKVKPAPVSGKSK